MTLLAVVKHSYRIFISKVFVRFYFAQEYPKLSKAYYGMLEVLTQDHMEFICSLEPDVFVYILSSILEGLTGLGKKSFISFLTLRFSCFFILVFPQIL